MDDNNKEEENEDDEEENKLEKGNFFGYVDENGNVVYVDLEEEDNVVIFPSQNANISPIIDGLNEEISGMSVVDDNTVTTIESTTTTKMEISNNDISLKSVSESLTEINPISTETKNTEINKTDKNGKTLPLKNEKHGSKKSISTVFAPAAVITNLSKYFLERIDPSPRINPCLMVRIKVKYVLFYFIVSDL